MLHSLNKLSDYHVIAQDGDIGYCKDFLFSDEDWRLHYMLADTHKWMPGGHKVLLHARTITSIDDEKKIIEIALDRSTIENSPGLPSNEPISRAYEKTYQTIFDYAYFHVGPNPLDAYFMGTHLENIKIVAAPKEPDSEKNHEHSAHFIEDYDLQTADKKHGHIRDFILDDNECQIKYVAVDVKHWIGNSDPVLIEPSHLKQVSWPKQKVYIDLSAKEVEAFPEFKEQQLAFI